MKRPCFARKRGKAVLLDDNCCCGFPPTAFSVAIRSISICQQSPLIATIIILLQPWDTPAAFCGFFEHSFTPRQQCHPPSPPAIIIPCQIHPFLIRYIHPSMAEEEASNIMPDVAEAANETLIKQPEQQQPLVDCHESSISPLATSTSAASATDLWAELDNTLLRARAHLLHSPAELENANALVQSLADMLERVRDEPRGSQASQISLGPGVGNGLFMHTFTVEEEEEEPEELLFESMILCNGGGHGGQQPKRSMCQLSVAQNSSAAERKRSTGSRRIPNKKKRSMMQAPPLLQGMSQQNQQQQPPTMTSFLMEEPVTAGQHQQRRPSAFSFVLGASSKRPSASSSAGGRPEEEDLCCCWVDDAEDPALLRALPHLAIVATALLWLLLGAACFYWLDPEIRAKPFHLALLYAFELSTSIGWGDSRSSNAWSQAFCVLFTLFGVPFLFSAFANLGRLVTEFYCVDWLFLSAIVRRKQSHGIGHHPTSSSSAPPSSALRRRFPLRLVLRLLLIHQGLGILLYSALFRQFPVVSSVYFSITSMATIGLGDFSPQPTGWGETLVALLYFSSGIILLSALYLSIAYYFQTFFYISMRGWLHRAYVEHWKKRKQRRSVATIAGTTTTAAPAAAGERRPSNTFDQII